MNRFWWFPRSRGCSVSAGTFFFNGAQVKEPSVTQESHVQTPRPNLLLGARIIPKHIMGRWCVTVNTCCGAQLQHRPRESFGGCTRQDRLPPRSPSLLHSPTQNVRFMAGLRSGQLTEEGRCLGGPTTTQFTGKHHQPTSSGYVRSFLLLATASAAPSVSAVPGRADPSQCNVKINVVSIASRAPPNNGSPSATISNRRASPGLGAARSISQTMTFVVTRAPPSRHILAAAL